MAAASDEQGKKGELADWRGTHNSYTQVSSEAGLPGLVFYVAVIVICLRMNYRLYRQVAGRKGLEDYAGLSYCLLLSIIIYAIGTFFFHIAYSSYLPILAGMSVATNLVAQPMLDRLAGEEKVSGAIR
jgi:O-antigen ligase